jgi:chorismate-pyruvate lyase
MSQAEVDRAVARATGETRDFIENMGFSLMHITRPTTQRSGRRWRRRYRHRRKAKPILISTAA